jgi:TonB family protein
MTPMTRCALAGLMLLTGVRASGAQCPSGSAPGTGGSASCPAVAPPAIAAAKGRMLAAQLTGRWTTRLRTTSVTVIFREDGEYAVYIPGLASTREALSGTVADTLPAMELERGDWVLRDRPDGTALLCVRPGEDGPFSGFGEEQCGAYTYTARPVGLTWRGARGLTRFVPYGPTRTGEVHLELTVVSAPARPAVDDQPYFEFQVEKTAAQLPGQSSVRYPDMLKSANVEGEVLAQFIVDTDGRYVEGSFKVLKSSHDLFTAAVRNHLPNLRFSPAEVGGRKVKQLVQQPFTFALSKS